MKNLIKNTIIILIMVYVILLGCGLLPHCLDVFNVLEPWP